jgi:cob(I)alamin adenosyltransferase
VVGGRSPGSRAYQPRLPGRRVSASGHVRLTSPVTVAGPRRIRTGFPSPPTLNGVIVADVPRRLRAVTVNLTRIYTRLGDGGETHLGDMTRVPKTHPRIEAYGTVDELNAQIGLTVTVAGLPEGYREWLAHVQNDLFDVGADLSAPEDPSGERQRLRVIPEQTAWLEQRCDEVNETLAPLKSFVLPGGTAAAAHLHVCRTVCRRAERAAIACGEDCSPEAVRYLNRLSDLLFILSRAANGGEEPLWEPGRYR